jgi:hypothetical protein
MAENIVDFTTENSELTRLAQQPEQNTELANLDLQTSMKGYLLTGDLKTNLTFKYSGRQKLKKVFL